MQALEGEIIAMRAAGKTRREIAEHFGLEKEQVKNWINRYNRAQAEQAAGLPPKGRGGARKTVHTSEEKYQYESKRLKMENELLRDFHRLAGRK